MARIAYTPRPPETGTLDRRDWPVYSLAELAYFLSIPKPTLHSWTKERSDKSGKVVPPLIEPARRSEALFSFYNLIEAHLLSTTTKIHKVRPRAIRAALEELQMQNLAPGKHPLLSREFYTNGRDIFTKHIEQTINLSRGGQLGFRPILDQYLERIERDEQFLPRKLYPYRQGENRVVSIMPAVSSGRPVIDGTGIPVLSIWNRYRAGDTVEFIADDYDIAETQVKGAIHYIEQLKAA